VRELRKRLIVTTLLVSAMFAAACAQKGMSKEQQTLYTANQIAIRVDNLAKTAASAEASGGLTTNQARTIITWALASQKTLRATPGGWYPTVKAGWDEVKAGVPFDVVAKSPALQTAWAVVDALIASYGEEQK
jgi:hypothetical protein